MSDSSNICAAELDASGCGGAGREQGVDDGTIPPPSFQCTKRSTWPPVHVEGYLPLGDRLNTYSWPAAVITTHIQGAIPVCPGTHILRRWRPSTPPHPTPPPHWHIFHIFPIHPKEISVFVSLEGRIPAMHSMTFLMTFQASVSFF